VDEPVVVDVRDMLCAQALALVARAVARLGDGQALLVAFNTEDVRRDLWLWARDRGHAIEEAGAGRLRMVRTVRVTRP
jgi:TusA-related sulfurtransferase